MKLKRCWRRGVSCPGPNQGHGVGIAGLQMLKIDKERGSWIVLFISVKNRFKLTVSTAAWLCSQICLLFCCGVGRGLRYWNSSWDGGSSWEGGVCLGLRYFCEVFCSLIAQCWMFKQWGQKHETEFSECKSSFPRCPGRNNQLNLAQKRKETCVWLIFFLW